MSTPEIALVPARSRSLGAMTIGRVLPQASHRHVGPFVFLDHMGPVVPERPEALDVPPHPHIGLSTLTWLFDGELLHKDSLGRVQPIRPGEVNWMTSGRGIVHSERAAPGVGAQLLHGLQFWVALPAADEEMEPEFAHYGAAEVPVLDRENLRMRLVAGQAYGVRSPVTVRSPAFLLDVAATGRATLELPPEHAERAIYVIHGEAQLAATTVPAHTMAIVPAGEARPIELRDGARLVVFGGAPLEGPRFIWWNFVSSRAERIEEAARAWKEGRFPEVVGDPGPPITLEGEPHFPKHADPPPPA